jgi:hypothetical protein
MFHCDELQEFFRAYSYPVGEHALEMKRTQVNIPGHFIQVRLVAVIAIDVFDGFCNT